MITFPEIALKAYEETGGITLKIANLGAVMDLAAEDAVFRLLSMRLVNCAGDNKSYRNGSIPDRLDASLLTAVF